jgi:RNA polymerase sigma factor (sigma-70 family)
VSPDWFTRIVPSDPTRADVTVAAPEVGVVAGGLAWDWVVGVGVAALDPHAAATRANPPSAAPISHGDLDLDRCPGRVVDGASLAGSILMFSSLVGRFNRSDVVRRQRLRWTKGLLLTRIPLVRTAGRPTGHLSRNPPDPVARIPPEMGLFNVATNELSDEALLAGVAHRDDAATVAFVRRYQKRIFGLAFSMLGDPSAAEEVAQEALIRVWRHAPVFDVRRGSVTTWVLSITRNLAIDALRRRRSVPTDPDEFVARGLISNEGLPEESVLSRDSGPALRGALARLPKEQSRALVLAAVYGRTAAEISESESIPIGTAKTRIRAGMSKLRAAMSEVTMVERGQ